MQVEVHHAETGGVIHNFPSREGVVAQIVFLVAVKLVIFGNVIVRGEEKSTRAAGGIADGHARFRTHDFGHRFDERARRKVLSGSAFGIFGVFLEQAFVDFTLGVNIYAHPAFTVYQRDEAFELCRVLDAVLRFAEDNTQHAAFFAECG